jgi:hypothetical protein
MNLLGLGIVAFAGALLLVLALPKVRRTPKLRVIPALTRLYRAVGLSVEDGTRLLLSLGPGDLITKDGASALAGFALLRQLTTRTSLSDRPPVAVAGDAALALLAQDTMEAGYRTAGAAEFYQPTTGRLTGLTPYSSIAGTMPIVRDENVSAAVLIGHFGVEAALLADAAERGNTLVVGSSDDLAGQAALYASANEALIGEELFAAGAYLEGSPARVASLTVQDILRWLIILVLLMGAGLKLLGLI